MPRGQHWTARDLPASELLATELAQINDGKDVIRASVSLADSDRLPLV